MATEKPQANGPARDPQTGRFLPGNCGGGRKKAEFSLQALIDRKIPEERWGEIIDAMAKAAIGGDVPAARLLLEHRFGKPKVDVSLTGAGGGPIIIERHVPRPDYDGNSDADTG